MSNDRCCETDLARDFDPTGRPRDGARVLLTQAVEAEWFLRFGATADLKTDEGCRRVVRHGHLPERQIMTGIGPVAVRQPRVRDREVRHLIRRASASPRPILPPYAWCSEEPRYMYPYPLSERRVDRRLRVGAGRLARQGCSWLVGHDHRAGEGGLDRRTQAMERARPVGQELRLRHQKSAIALPDGALSQARQSRGASIMAQALASRQAQSQLVSLPRSAAGCLLRANCAH